MSLLFLGPSGVGKDTQADLLVENFPFLKIASGDVIRHYLANNNDKKSNLIRQQYQQGSWLNDYVLYELLAKELNNVSVNKKIIFVGLVRRISQIEHFSQLLKNLDRNLGKVVVFELDDEVAIKRLGSRLVCPKCKSIYDDKDQAPIKTGFCDRDGAKLVKREDDQPEAIKERLRNYRNHNQPLIDYYQKEEKLIKIDANYPVAEIQQTLITKLSL